MKDHQFEEIVMSFSIIIALLSYHFEFYWLFVIFAFKGVLDVYATIKKSVEAVREEEK